MRARARGFEDGTIVDKQWLEPSVILIFHIQNKPSAFNPPSIHVLYEYCADAGAGSLSRRLQILPHRRETGGHGRHDSEICKQRIIYLGEGVTPCEHYKSRSSIFNSVGDLLSFPRARLFYFVSGINLPLTITLNAMRFRISGRFTFRWLPPFDKFCQVFCPLRRLL